MSNKIKTYEVDNVRLGFMPDKNPMEGILTIEHPEHTPYTAHLRLAKTQSRSRYAREAAESRGVDQELIERILADLCTTRFEEIQAAMEVAKESGEHDEDRAEEDLAPEPGTERHERAMEVLTSTSIPERAAQTMEVLGHVGEWTAKMLAFVCALSAKAGYPIQPSTHAESSTGKNHLWDTVFLLFPVWMVLRWSAMSDKALFFTDEDLKGKILYLQEVSGSEGADFAIRVLQSAQYLEYVVTEKTADGSFRAVTYRKEGPVVVVQTTTKIRLFNENDTRVFPIYLDESREQTERIVSSALERAEIGSLSKEEREAILEVWHDAISLLQPAEVRIPFAQRVVMPHHRVRVRRDVNRFLDMIRVYAWLHQHSREQDNEGRILATEEDFYAVLKLVSDSLQRAWKEMTPAEEAVMDTIQSLPEASRKNGFKRSDLQVKGQSARRVQDALKGLTETGHVECEKRGGPGGYRYTVPHDLKEAVLGISLRPSDESEDGADETNEEAGEEPAQGSDTDEEEDEADPIARAIARNEERAIESPVLRQEAAIARSREEESGGDWKDEEVMDYVKELTDLGWYRAQTTFTVDDGTEDYLVDADPIAQRLRHEVSIYKGRNWWSNVYGPSAPHALTAEDLFEMGPERNLDQSQHLEPWPATSEEMSVCLKRVISLLQTKAHRFWDIGFSDWYASMGMNHPRDREKVCKEAYLHAELWRNEHTGEEIWALTALQEGWSPPTREIEGAVWVRVQGHVTIGPDARAKIDTEEENSDGYFKF